MYLNRKRSPQRTQSCQLVGFIEFVVLMEILNSMNSINSINRRSLRFIERLPDKSGACALRGEWSPLVPEVWGKKIGDRILDRVAL